MPPKKKSARSRSPKPGPSSAKAEETRSVANTGKFMKLLQARELGLVQNFNFPDETFRQKMSDFRRVRSHRFGNEDELLHTTYFLRAGRNALVGAWYVQLRNVFTTVVAQLHYDLNRVVFGKTGYIESKSTVLDACQVFVNPDCFLCVSSNVNKHTGEVHIATPRSRDEHELIVFSYRHPNHKDFWCCNANFFTRRFALGCDYEVCLYSVAGLEEIRPLKENVYSLAYNRCGTLLHMGCETGEFLVYDIRTSNTSLRMKPDDKLLDDVVVLHDENHCLVSGVSGKLMKIDIRMARKILDYPNHERRSRKIPVSVNEKYNAVSCTGADDRTRIWCLKTGDLLHSFAPPSTYPARSCLVPHSSRCHIHLIQDHYIHVYSLLK